MQWPMFVLMFICTSVSKMKNLLLGKKKTHSLFVDIVDDVIRSFPYRNLMSCNFNDCLIVSLSPLFSVSLETSS